MKRLILTAVCAVALMTPVLTTPVMAQEAVAYDARAAFAPFTPLIGKTWRGQGVGPDGARVEDVARWEWAVGGHAVRVVHAVNGGVYGGETLIAKEGDGYVFHYFTTGGFHTTGTMTVSAPGVLTIDETVHGASTIQRLRSRAEMGADGTYRVRSLTERDGAWVEAGGFDYRQDATARVVLPVVKDADEVAHQGLRISRRIVATNGEKGGTSAVYFRVSNISDRPDALIGASCTCADTIEIHQIRADRSGMDTLPELVVPAGASVDVRPGSPLHLMLLNHDPETVVDGSARVTLNFREAGQVELPFRPTADSRGAWAAFD